MGDTDRFDIQVHIRTQPGPTKEYGLLQQAIRAELGNVAMENETSFRGSAPKFWAALGGALQLVLGRPVFWYDNGFNEPKESQLQEKLREGYILGQIYDAEGWHHYAMFPKADVEVRRAITCALETGSFRPAPSPAGYGQGPLPSSFSLGSPFPIGDQRYGYGGFPGQFPPQFETLTGSVGPVEFNVGKAGEPARQYANLRNTFIQLHGLIGLSETFQEAELRVLCQLVAVTIGQQTGKRTEVTAELSPGSATTATVHLMADAQIMDLMRRLLGVGAPAPTTSAAAPSPPFKITLRTDGVMTEYFLRIHKAIRAKIGDELGRLEAGATSAPLLDKGLVKAIDQFGLPLPVVKTAVEGSSLVMTVENMDPRVQRLIRLAYETGSFYPPATRLGV